ncbi:UNVERIFIED_ORG: hypothetical protein GGD59_006609 [Rhizobium esperanzae]
MQLLPMDAVWMLGSGPSMTEGEVGRRNHSQVDIAVGHPPANQGHAPPQQLDAPA